MRKSIRILSTAVALFAIAGTSFAASPWALYGSFSAMGDHTAPIGGIRYSMSSDICFDFGAGAKVGYKNEAENNVALYFDAFFVGQTIGVFLGISKVGEDDVVPTLGLAYTLERAINDKIVLGCCPTLVSYDVVEGAGVKLFNGVNVYTVIGF